MSLSFEGFLAAIEEWEKVNKRLNKLLGFNPSVSNHYGVIQIYNRRINSKTSDEEILKIRIKYLEWKFKVLSTFAENKFPISIEQFDNLFSVDCMYGTLSFLDIPVDIYESFDTYIKKIKNYIDTERGKIMKQIKSINNETIQNWVKRIFKNMFEQNLLSNDEIYFLHDLEYSKRVFGINFPMLVDSQPKTIVSGHQRYWQKPIGLYYVCSQWWKENEKDYEEKIYRWLNRVLPNYTEHGLVRR